MSVLHEIVVALERNTQKQGALMSSITELTGTVDKLTANIGALVTSSDALIALVKTPGGLSAVDQAALDKAVADLQTASTTVTGETAKEQAATPVPPVPPAVP